MALDPNDVNRHLRSLFGQHEDSFQDAWVEILKCNAQTITEVAPMESLHSPAGRNGNGSFTLEWILASPSLDDNAEPEEGDDSSSTRLYEKVVDFLTGEYVKQRNENLGLKKKEIDLKAERVRLRGESLKFKKDRFESWRQLMEEKGKEKEGLLRLKAQLRREELEFRKEQLLVRISKARKGGQAGRRAAQQVKE
jgi:hypothetical protein